MKSESGVGWERGPGEEDTPQMPLPLCWVQLCPSVVAGFPDVGREESFGVSRYNEGFIVGREALIVQGFPVLY